jgi:excisionase family DNA binding protein
VRHRGRAITVRYRGNGGISPTYECSWMHREGLATKNCLSVRTGPLDEAIGAEVFKVLKPAEIELALAALHDLEQRDQAVMRQWNMRIERAEYECALAERRYAEVDPSNRLVASSLERRWNEALVQLDALKVDAATFQSQKARVVTAEQKAKVLALARDLPRLWRATTTQPKDRKRMLRLLIRDITVDKPPQAKRVVLHVRWQGGACTDIVVDLPPSIAERLRYTPLVVEQVRELAGQLSDRQIVDALNQQGVRSSRGLPFTLAMIKWIRYRYDVPSGCAKRPEELTVKQLSERLGVSIHYVHYWLRQGAIKARQVDGRGPWRIKLDDKQEHHLLDHVRMSAHLQNRPRTMPDASNRSALASQRGDRRRVKP